jgi:O-antigen/teichoic acid export membrane protein
VSLPQRVTVIDPGPPSVPSLREHSAGRVLAQIGRLLLGFGVAVLTARSLGPADKGTLSTLSFMGVFLSCTASLGLGEAAAVVAHRKQLSHDEAVSASLLPAAFTSLVAVAVLWAVAAILDWSRIGGGSLTALSAFVVVGTFAYMLLGLENSREHFSVTSRATVLQTLSELIAVVVFVVGLGWGLLGGALSLLSGVTASCGLLSWSIWRSGYRFKLPPRGLYLAAAIRFGVINQSGFLLMFLLQRADLLMVYALLDERAAGLYAVALTIAATATYAAGALSGASFPRVAKSDPASMRFLVPRLIRMTVLVAGTSVAVLLVTVPFLVPVVFGSRFEDAVGITLLLTAAGIPGSVQLLLARVAAASDRPGVYLMSYLGSLVTMITLDGLLIPSLGLPGAALAVLPASLMGLGIGYLRLRRDDSFPPLRACIPRPEDLMELANALRAMARQAVRAVGR